MSEKCIVCMCMVVLARFFLVFFFMHGCKSVFFFFLCVCMCVQYIYVHPLKLSIGFSLILTLKTNY